MEMLGCIGRFMQMQADLLDAMAAADNLEVDVDSTETENVEVTEETLNAEAQSDPAVTLYTPATESNTNGMEPLRLSSITFLSSIPSNAELQQQQRQDNLDKYVYNVPDGLEKNPEMLRAELLFYNTPQMEAYSEDVYKSLVNVQEQCEVDYQKYCAPATNAVGMKAEYIDLQEVANTMMPTFTMYMLNRRRQLAAKKASGKELIDSFRSYYLPQSMLGSSVVTDEAKKEVTKAIAGSGLISQQQVDSKNHIEPMKAPTAVRSNVIINGRLSKEGRRFADGHLMPNKRSLREEHDHHHDHDHDHHHDKDHNDPPRPAPVGGSAPGYDPTAPIGPGGKKPYDPNDPNAPPIGPGGKKPYDPNDPRGPYAPGGDKPYPPPPPPGPRGPPPPPPRDGGDSDSDSDSDGEDEEEEGPHGRRHGRHHGPNPWEDHSFPGALGFGAGGDMCMYQNAQQISTGCLQAIGEVHALREQYWNEHVATTSPHHHPHFLLLFFALVGFIHLVKRCCYRKQYKAVRDLLVGLNTDAELKAQVESRLGVVVPELPKCAYAQDGRPQSCLAKTCTILGVFFASLVASFFITITSLEMTAAIVHHMDEHNPNGETTPPPVALFILFLICSAQVGLLTFTVYKIKKCYRRNQEQIAASASAPPTPTVINPHYTTTTSNNNNNNGSSDAPGVQYIPVQFKNWIVPRISAVSSAITNWGRRVNTTVNSPSGYAPLLGDETEMIAVGSTHGGPATATSSHCPRYAVFTGVPVMGGNQFGATTTMVPVQATPVNAVHFV